MTAHERITRSRCGAAALFAASLLPACASAAPVEMRARVATGQIISPASSQETGGATAHTNVKLFVPNGHSLGLEALPSGYFETPASLACLYKLVTATKACNPVVVTAVATGGSKVVVIVDAYDYPTARHDLAAYSRQFGLPLVTQDNFEVVYAGGKRPAVDPSGGWELEESLDVQMAHAMAPSAKIILVEANSPDFIDLFAAEAVAGRLASQAGGGEVSNSWGSSELLNEEILEPLFTAANVVFFASTGDMPGVEEPSVLSNVVAVGGTSVNRDAQGDFIDQSIWWATGGGTSQYVPIPAYQSAIAGITGRFRGVPDVSLVADPATGVWIYDTTPYIGQVLGWIVIGGTSVASPAVAGIVNNAKSFAVSSASELTTIYANLGNTKTFTDVSKPECGNGILQPRKGWNACTGIGTPRGRAGK